MNRAILIDDERPALRELAYLLQNTREIEVAGMFTNPQEGVAAVAALKPEAVFLDISMPQLSGLDAALVILDQSPETRIIFVTAYDRYAVEAFEMYALDYLLKPVTYERLEKTIARLNNKAGSQSSTGKTLTIRCLGKFQIGWDGEEPIKWRSGKTEELFAFLLHNRGKDVTKDEIIDTIWPNTEMGRAVPQLHSAIYYIRKTLSDYGVAKDQLSINGCYHLNIGNVNIDVELLKRQCEKINLANDQLSFSTENLIYSGSYFEDNGWLWAETVREKLFRKYVHAVLVLSETLIEAEDFENAEDILKDAYSKNPYEDKITMLLLTLYGATGEKAEAAKHYRSYSRILENELGVEPTREIKIIYDEIQGK